MIRIGALLLVGALAAFAHRGSRAWNVCGVPGCVTDHHDENAIYCVPNHAGPGGTQR